MNQLTNLVRKSLSFAAAAVFVPSAWAQCATGIPSAGNPGCIPPDQDNSPYYQGEVRQYEERVKWADRWGAIAVDLQTDSLGTGEDQADEKSAERAALDSCRIHDGVECKIKYSYVNECISIAESDEMRGYGFGLVEFIAQKDAIKSCGDENACRTTYTHCSLPARVK